MHQGHSPVHNGPQVVASPPFGMSPLGGPSHMQV